MAYLVNKMVLIRDLEKGEVVVQWKEEGQTDIFVKEERFDMGDVFAVGRFKNLVEDKFWEEMVDVSAN